MAASAALQSVHDEHNRTNGHTNGSDDPFLGSDEMIEQPYFHRFSSRFEVDAADLGAAASPSQVKRVLEAHLLETERRLQDTHKLGTTLLRQQTELQDKLQEVEQQQDEAEISPELKQRLASIGREHDDVSREIARSLLAPKSRAVSGENQLAGESTTLTSQATGSPTKLSAPNRRSRNQPTNRAGDLQFAADISTSLLAQVRQLQAAVAERDDAIKTVNTQRSKLEQDVQVFVQKLRSHDENEQRYKDENWNLEAQNHELLSAQREAVDKEKKLHAAIAVANAEKIRLLNEMEESKMAHGKVAEEHAASKKAHETEIISLKRDFDAADSDRLSLQNKIDELTAQNQELAKGMAGRYRNMSPQRPTEINDGGGDLSKDMSTPEHSPPPSPTKPTPRHGGLESETLKSSLHHAHRMIQNLKSNIHREKTEKIELKRMLQDARDELEQRRNDSGFGAGAKKAKSKNEVFKKPARPDMLGSNRRPRTDIELQEDDWEDQAAGGPSQSGLSIARSTHGMTDLSDAYQTAHETESNFETADERQNTESEAFETGAESLAGDSTDDLTETESTAPRSQPRGFVKHNRPSLAFKSAGARDSYLSTASTSAGEEEDELQTPIQAQTSRFRMKNGRLSSRQTQIYEGTPDSVRTQATSAVSPSTVVDGRSPPGVEQSLFAELEGMGDNSSTFSTPARSSMSNLDSTPGLTDTPSKSLAPAAPVVALPKVDMVDSGTMTEPWQPEPLPAVAAPVSTLVDNTTTQHLDSTHGDQPRTISIGDFPLPPAGPAVANVDIGTQYTPQKSSSSSQLQVTPTRSLEMSTHQTPSRTLIESPIRGSNQFDTPPKTVWDAEHESEIGSPDRHMAGSLDFKPQMTYSGMLSQTIIPSSPALPPAQEIPAFAFSGISSQQTHPIAPPPSLPPTIPLPAVPDSKKHDQSTVGTLVGGAAAGGILATAAAALGLSRAKDEKVPMQIPEDDTAGSVTEGSSGTGAPLQDVSGNAASASHKASESALTHEKTIPFSVNDQGSQTMLTAEEIQQALLAGKKAAAAPITLSNAVDTVPELPSKSLIRSPDLNEPPATSSSSAPTSPPLRPSSASSWRPMTGNRQHPPLPSDYKTNIARANSLAQNNVPKKDLNVPAVGSVMGPPLMPASAMRRPKTPAESTRSPSRDNATIRTNNSIRQRAGTESQISRRSSVSSFASEVDQRFNLRPGAVGHGFEPAPGTDPRMIQAITQTMIGEYLWKYTRRAGSKEMSTSRHRRYFWVHPYTKTLYWSTIDPSLPGSKEGTSRSVPIESIRVVSDDNPLPPGLHRKSLEVTTPTRKLKFTASTGQRHETWFNALSYLLLRGEPPDTHGAYATGGNEITRDDIDEFRVSGHNPHLMPNDRQSLSSYNSRTTAGTSKRVSAAASLNQRQPLPSNVVTTSNSNLRQQGSLARNSSVPPTADSSRASRGQQPREWDKDRTIRASSVSRVSRMLGSITGRSSRQGNHETSEVQQAGHARGASHETNSIYDASVVSATRDSQEEARQEMLRQEAAGLGSNGGLENVRACCDGKHDVSMLAHGNRHHDRHRTLSSMSGRINRSMSKRI